MPFSHHSHSGQFCPGHAKDMLEEMVITAIQKKMKVFALTEHMPRHDADRYPEETEPGSILESGMANQANYYAEATRLRQKYGAQIEIPIGFESDFCRTESQALIEQVLANHSYDFFVGSLHHVHAVPIDYDRPLYEQARNQSGGTDERLFEHYFDEQLQMLTKLRPPVVGHFDLIRLKSDDPNRSFQTMPSVWQRILRNLDWIASYGGIVEINTSALRKGMSEPYPKAEICREHIKRGGKFCLSDDSHGIEQVATHYHLVPSFLREAGITALHFLGHSNETSQSRDVRFPFQTISHLSLDSFEELEFWNNRSE